MTIRVNRRTALGFGTVATAGAVLGTAGPASAAAVATTPRQAADQVAAAYAEETALAGGSWRAYVSVADPGGAPQVAVADESNVLLQAYSVNKVAVATAVLDKVDRGLGAGGQPEPLLPRHQHPAGDPRPAPLLRSPIAFTDGIRREMSSAERARIGTKAGWFGSARQEAGVIFDASGAPVLTYALFADGQARPDDFGATHPAVQARARMGRRFLTAVDGLAGTGRTYRAPAHRPSNGG
ncbi:hypothetical protein [Micromonospora sp. NPDC048830]|uniref:hypothetical protein n=1 Tax=Micromonospora sp. NPDC048830 TaxID=3364257 RepID=UPI003715E004